MDVRERPAANAFPAVLNSFVGAASAANAFPVVLNSFGGAASAANAFPVVLNSFVGAASAANAFPAVPSSFVGAASAANACNITIEGVTTTHRISHADGKTPQADCPCVRKLTRPAVN